MEVSKRGGGEDICDSVHNKNKVKNAISNHLQIFCVDIGFLFL